MTRSLTNDSDDSDSGIVCKACGASLGILDDYDEGDHVECPDCGTGYDFAYRPDSRHPDHLKMFTDPTTTGTRPEPTVAAVHDVHDGVVLWEAESGVHYKDYVEDFDGDLPGGEGE